MALSTKIHIQIQIQKQLLILILPLLAIQPIARVVHVRNSNSNESGSIPGLTT